MSLHGLCMWSQPARLPYPWPANLSPGVLQPPPHYQTAMQEAETLCPSAEDHGVPQFTLTSWELS